MSKMPSSQPLDFHRLEEAQMLEKAREFRETASRRRSVRHFSDEPVPLEVLDECILAAASAPSGAHRQPWTFVVVTDPEIKRQMRVEVERVEHQAYSGRMNEEWLRALEPFGTDEHKPFIELAPALIVVFRHAWGEEDGRRVQNYYTQESVGIACGMLLAALNNAGLATLTHTPSPMGFLQQVLGRPSNEKAFLLIPVGYPEKDCEVPRLQRKTLEQLVVRR